MNDPGTITDTPMQEVSPPYKACGAKTRSGKPCKTAAMPNGRCRMHGGATPHGIALPQFKHGRHSKYLPQPLAAKHEANLAAMAEVFSLREEISLLDTRISELCERLSTGERGSLWDDLQGLIEDAESSSATAEQVMPVLKEIVTKGLETTAAWRDLTAAIHAKAKVASMEARRMADAGEIATKDEVKTLVLQIVNVVRDHVTDPAQLRAISSDLTVVLHGKGGPQKPMAG